MEKMKKRTLATFAITLLVMTVVSSVVWEVIGSRLYDCTDECGFGFLSPGTWVHEFDGRKIINVSTVVHGRSMGEPDAILQGWSTPKLWGLWCLFAGASLCVSIIFALIHWKHAERDRCEQTAGERTS